MQPGSPQQWNPAGPEPRWQGGAPVYPPPSPAGEPYPSERPSASPAERSAASPPDRGTPKARTGLVILVAFLVELVAIAAVCNQSVSDTARDYAERHGGVFPNGSVLAHLAEATLTYAWRFSPPGSDPNNVWPAEMLRLLTVFVITALLVLAIIRGAVTFGRAFLGIWMAVIVATCLGNMVAALVIDQPDRGTIALFNAVTGYIFIAGVGLGVFVALIAALVAVATRRITYPAGAGPFAPVEPAPDYAGGYGAPSIDEQDRPRHAAGPEFAPPPYAPPPPFATTRLPDAQRQAYAQDDRGTQQFAPPPDSARPAETTEFPRVPDTDDQTRQLPRMPLGAEPNAPQVPRIPVSDAPAGPGQPPATPSAPAETAPPVPGPPPAPESGSAQRPASAPSTAGDPQRTQFREPTPPTSPGASTLQFPRPPDDEDLGHEPM